MQDTVDVVYVVNGVEYTRLTDIFEVELPNVEKTLV